MCLILTYTALLTFMCTDANSTASKYKKQVGETKISLAKFENRPVQHFGKGY